jgi:excinuclease ABC subunit C
VPAGAGADEAHLRHWYHRTLREKAMGESKLDGIPGVGAVLRQRLLARFGSVERIRKAPLEELTAVPGLSPRKAQSIKDALG